MTKPFSPNSSNADREQAKFLASPDNKTAVRIVDVSKLEWKRIAVSYPSSIEEEYQYINDDDVEMYKIRITYSNSSKQNIVNVERL